MTTSISNLSQLIYSVATACIFDSFYIYQYFVYAPLI
jgi:hypothetical protein